MTRWLPIVAALLVGCPRPAPPQPQIVVVPVPTPREPIGIAETVLSAVAAVVALPRERQQEEVERCREALANADFASDRLRLALLLLLGDPSLRDTGEARGLIEGRTWDPTEETLVRLVLALVDEHDQRLTEGVEAREALATERARRKLLEERLEALKAIETDMGQREEGGHVDATSDPDR